MADTATWAPPEADVSAAPWTSPEAASPTTVASAAPKADFSADPQGLGIAHPTVGAKFDYLYGMSFGGLETLDQRLNSDQKTAFDLMDKNGGQPKENRARAINQAYLQTQMPHLSPDTLTRNWDRVKSIYAKNVLGLPDGNLNDTALYSKIGERIGSERAWEGFNEVRSMPIVKLPELKDAPDMPQLGINNPALIAGVWNAIKPQLESLETPEGLATAGVATRLHVLGKTYPLAKKAMMAMGGIFSGFMAHAAYVTGKQAPKILNDPKASFQDKVTAVANPVANAAASLLGVMGTAFEMFPDGGKAIAAKLKGKFPDQAATILKEEAAQTDLPGHAAALEDAATRLELIGRFAAEGDEPHHAIVRVGADPEWEKLMGKPFSTASILSKEGKVIFSGDIEGAKAKGFDITQNEDGTFTVKTPQGEELPVAGQQSTLPAPPMEPPPAEPAAPALPEEPSGSLISVKNETIDAELRMMGLPEATHGEKTSFEAARADAAAKMADDPFAGQKLIASLTEKSRPVTSNEDALLLTEQNRLRLERDAAEKELMQATDSGDAAAQAEARLRVAKARDDFQHASEVVTKVGTANAQGLALRQMMMREDFSLAGMEERLKRASGGKPISEEQSGKIRQISEDIKTAEGEIEAKAKKDASRLKAMKTRTRRETAELEQKVAEGDTSKPVRQPVPLDDEALRLKANLERVKQKFRLMEMQEQRANRTPWEKVRDAFVKWVRLGALSWPTVLVKLTGAALARSVSTPVEQIVGYGASKLLPELAAKAPAEGVPTFSGMVRAESKAISEGLSKGMKGAWDMLHNRDTDEQVILDKLHLPPEAVDFLGKLHGALKYPTQIADYSRRLQLRTEAAMRQGIDVNNPVQQLRLMHEAWMDSKRAIFLQDNGVVNAYKAALRSLEAKQKSTGEPSLALQLMSTGIQTELPIVKVPTNIIAEVSETLTGALTGPAKAAWAYYKGIENLKPGEADAILRLMKKGSIGLALTALGYFKAQQIGGYYQRGEHRPAADVKADQMRVGGVNVPQQLLHNPYFEDMQFGATMSRVAGALIRKAGGQPKGPLMGLVGASMGLFDQVPFVRETSTLDKLATTGGFMSAADQKAASILVPGVVQWIAAQMDKETPFSPLESAKPRKPTNLKENIEKDLPVLRERVPQQSPTGRNTYTLRQ